MRRSAITGVALPLASLLLASALGAATPVALKTTEFGNGPTLVLVHSLGSARTSWMPTARKLLSGHHVVMVELPGHGESPLPDPFSLEAAAEAVSAVVARQKAESTVVVGQGVGGLLALLAASAHPERQRGLVLIDVATRFESPIPDQQQRFFLQYMDQNYDTFLQQMYMGRGRDSAQSVALHAQAALVPPATMKAYMRERLNFDGSGALKALRVPLLFIGTEKQWPADKDWPTLAKQLGFEGAPSTTARRIANAGPMLASDQPDTLAAVLSEFTAKLLPRK